jgi:hypothetical protein
MNGKQKLEFTWIGKDKRPRVEARILLEDSGKSYHAGRRVATGDIFVLARCEWRCDDYSLDVANLPMSAPEAASTPDLFGDVKGKD